MTAPEGSLSVEVLTSAGAVRGVGRSGSYAFLGIPYAEPPIGELRFGAPVAHAGWAGVRDAGHQGATPQRGLAAEITLIPEPSVPGESTLNVNVFTPRPNERTAKLPVLVWIHGGGFVSGSPASPWYDGTAFNRDGVVTVSLSYRLGFDGFGWIEDAPANRGVLDWVLALEWVRDNIAAFGGDPAQVTIAGQSAGGAAVLCLLAVPRAAKLFHRVIALSPPEPDMPLDRAEGLGRAVARLGGVAPTRAGLETLDELRIFELQNQVGSVIGQEEIRPEPADPLAGLAALVTGGLSWAPVVDGELLPQPVATALADGVGADKQLALGSTDHEFTMAVTPHAASLAGRDPVTSLERFEVPVTLAAEYVAAHPGLDTVGILGQYASDAIFRRVTRKLAEIRATTGSPTWVYRFSWQSPVFSAAIHCLDVPFFFDCLDGERVAALAGDRPPADLARTVHGAAVNFISGGEPGWPAYTSPDRVVQIHDAPSSTMADGYRDVALLSAAPEVV